MRLAADAMLGRLAKWLRILGYDTRYWRGHDAGLVLVVLSEDRLLLTRDTRLVRRLRPEQVLFIESDHYGEQVRQVLARLGPPPRRGHRCIRCNLPLERADKPELRGKVPEYVWLRHDRFARCGGCGRIYWEGTHFERMREALERLCA
jgi:uncharacterized protein with PIN domain